MIERCSCGALIVALRHSVVLAWRTDHRHEMEPEEGPQSAPGYVHESVSQNERGWPEYVPDTVARPPIGFALV